MISLLNKISFKEIWKNLKKPSPEFSIILTTILFILILNKDLIGNLQLQFILEQNNLSFLANLIDFAFHFYFTVFKYIFYIASSLSTTFLILAIAPHFKILNRLEGFLNNSFKNIVSALFRLIKIAFRLIIGTFLILTLVSIIFYGKTFLLTIFDFRIERGANFEMIELNYLSEYEFWLFHIFLVFNLFYSIAYTLYFLFKEDKNLPF